MKSISLMRYILLLTLVACSATPERHVYTLSPTMGDSATPSVIGLDVKVSVPAYLDSASIALASDTHEYTYAANHQWVEPVEDGIASVLRRQLERAEIPRRPAVIEVDIERFHGALGGQVTLEAIWRVRDSASETGFDPRRFQAMEQQGAKGYAELVQTHHRLLKRLATEIASTLSAL